MGGKETYDLVQKDAIIHLYPILKYILNKSVIKFKTKQQYEEVERIKKVYILYFIQ